MLILKKLVLAPAFFMIFGGSLAVAAETTERKIPALYCENPIYRTALLRSAENAGLEVKDSFLPKKELTEVLQRKLGLRPGSLLLDTVALRIRTADLECQVTTNTFFSCRSARHSALVDVTGWITSPQGGSSRLQLEGPVEVGSFEIRTELASAGPVELGPDPVTVPLDQMKMTASARLTIHGRALTLKWNTPYVVGGRPSSVSSYCRVGGS